MTDDPLLALLATEIQRHLAGLTPDPTSTELRAVLHAVKGSAALARHQDLALLASQLGARLRSGDDTAHGVTIGLLRRAAERLTAGLPPLETRWPQPPADLVPSVINADFRAGYAESMNARLLELDENLDRNDPSTSLHHAYRIVHGLKSTASSAGDEVTAWYCHGLESSLQQVPQSEAAAHSALDDLARHRGVIGQLVDHPARALDTLRGLKSRLPGPPPTILPSSTYPSVPSAAEGDAVLRVPTAVVDTIADQLDRATFVNDELLRLSAAARQTAARLRDRRTEILDGLRDVGSVRERSTGALRVEAAARDLTSIADRMDEIAFVCRRNAQLVNTTATDLRAEVAALRRTTARWLFDRLQHAITNLAPSGHEVRVVCSGADLSIERRTADILLEPVLQLARNAVAHGLESPEERLKAGKPPVGTIFLHAERHGTWLRFSVEDDGRGVDLSKIRSLAEQRGATLPEDGSDDDLLSLLFVPGITTREGADLLAGRGVGLELAQDAVRALGGAIRLATRPDGGLAATVEVPAERGTVDVLWLEVNATELALPASYIAEVGSGRDQNCVALAACLGLPTRALPAVALRLELHGVQPVWVGVDAAAHVEQALIRPVPALVAAVGPFSGAVLRSDGSLRLVLDPPLVAARAWARLA